MTRGYYFRSLRRFFDKRWYAYAYKAGKDSGYQKCCILTFFVRAFMLDLYGAVVGNVDPFMTMPRLFNSHLELKIYQQSKEYKRTLKHIACPWHRLIYFLTRKEHHYIMCGECAWIQYEKHERNNCAQNDHYGTKARRMKRG